MSGSIKFNNSGQIRTAGANDTYALTIFGQPDNFNASYLAVTSENNKTPRFECAVGDGTTKKMLTGKLDSSLVWDGKNIVRTIDGKTADVLGNINLNHIYVKETWKSGTSWYRVWSDGYIEQGGRGTSAVTHNSKTVISFHKPMSTTNYTIEITATNTTNANHDGSYNLFTESYAFTTTSFTVGAKSDNGAIYAIPFCWYACGY